MAYVFDIAAFSLISGSITLRILMCIAAILPIVWVYHFVSTRPLSGIPIVTMDGMTPQQSWYTKSREILTKGRKLYPNQPFQVVSYGGPKLILPQKYLKEVRDAPEAELFPYMALGTPYEQPGFDAFKAFSKHTSLVPDVLRIKLTQSLGLITSDLAEEGLLVTEELFGKLAPGQWHNVKLLPHVTQIIGRFTARTMLGEEMAHNPEYVDISIQHGTLVFPATFQLRRFPRVLWPIISWFHPSCKMLRQHVRRARKLIGDEVERRAKSARATLAAGQKVPKTHDSVAWVLEQNKSGDELDLVGFQLMISVAAIHNTSGHLFTALWYLIANPKYIQLVREEAISVLKEYGWTRQGLARLRLQDGVHKECLRILRSSIPTVRRQIIKQDLTFSDGLTAPKGQNIIIVPQNEYLGEKEEFYPERWIEKRSVEGEENKHAFVAANTENQEYGIGRHSCPGRWFANDELKIATCILLLRYDWKAPTGMPTPYFPTCEEFPITSSALAVYMTPREPEIDLSNPRI
ncbi:cytochrome P450 [Curvularia clavata]|uniref:Cytochrome P450 n=1 Tax=Curvularia clavata TaxID=95742 RepID=A0A9Q8ZD01_CURCL|nr:cytochrome P450 [Curvularia clavata]